MYPSNRVKRRPAPYEVELDEGRRILDLYKYGALLLCPPSANIQYSLLLSVVSSISIVIHPLTRMLHCA